MAMLTCDEMAEELKCSVKSVRRMVDDGMPAVRVRPRLLRFDRDAALEWLTENRPAVGGASVAKLEEAQTS